MLTSYFKIALRYLAKSKIYSFINIAGLSLGLACAMLILLYTKDELSFDAFHKNANSIYQVTVDVRFPDGSSMEKMGMSSILLGPYLKSNLPEVQSHLRLAKGFWDVKLGDVVQSQSVLLADSNFLSLLTFPLLHGNARTALHEPNSIVITEDMAIRHFGTVDALDKTILFERGGEFKPYTVTGIAKRIPQNSSIQFEALLPLTPKPEEQGNERWVSIDVNTLLLLSNGSDVPAVADKIQKLYVEVSKEAFAPVRAQGFNQMFHHNLQPIKDIHLSQEFKAEFGFGNGSNPMYSYILSGIALFILTIACINFVNLTIARSIKRTKEIGIRKVVGSGRQQLIAQFLGESFLLCCFSFLGALLLAQLVLPLFNDMTNKALSLSYLFDAQLVIGYVALFIITALLAGFYPALVLSGFNPVQTLYNQFRLTGKNYLQKGLVIFQFTLATVMILGTLTIYFQFEYLTNKDLGYDSNNLLHVPKRNLTQREAKLFGEQLMKHPNIISVAPFAHSGNNAKISRDSIRHFTYDLVDENFVNLLKLQIVEGRNFSSQFPADSSKAVLVNEAFVKMAGLKTPIGHEIDFFLTNEKKMIVGIIKDYHFASLREAISPQCFGAKPQGQGWEFYTQMLIRIKPNSEANSLPHIEQTFRKLFPMQPFTYQFDDDQNLKQYAAEAKWKQVILFGAILTIFISAFGLFGLSILTAEKRFKEIGIRKVLGASARTIVLTLTRDFLLLISFSLLIAMPIGYFAGTSWLENYPYRINISAWIFVVTAIMVLIIAICTISYQSIKTALMNPAESLKRD
jgi:putative ABC transport system permease protein